MTNFGNRMELFHKNSPIAKMIKGDEMGKEFGKRVTEQLPHARKAVASGVGFSVILNQPEYQKQFDACRTSGDCVHVCETLAARNRNILSKEVAWGDEADHAAYIMALIAAKEEDGPKIH